MIKILFMKKIIAIGSFLSLLVFVMISCKKNNLVVDKDPPIPPEKAEFTYTSGSSFARSFYVKSTAPGNVFKIPVGITNLSDKDRTIQFTYTSTTAVQGTHYNAPSSIIIKAGLALDSLPVTGVFANIPSGTSYVVKIKITGGDVPIFAGKDSVILTLRRYCDVVLASMGGNFIANEYSATGGFAYGPYPSGVINLTSTGATTASGAFVNLFDYGWNNINFTMDWSDPSNFIVDIPLQATGATNAAGNYSYVRGTAGKTNTFSSCDQTYSISLDLMLDPTTVDYSGYQIRLKR